MPVPMFLPVTMNSAERIVETIKEIKQKIPSDPFEAELILMAEMVAEQDEKNDKQETRREKALAKETERQDVPDGNFLCARSWLYYSHMTSYWNILKLFHTVSTECKI